MFMPSSPVLLSSSTAYNILPNIYYTCFSTLWHCHPYILFNENLSRFTGFSLYKNSHMSYYVSIKAYSSTFQEFCAGQYVRLYGRLSTIPT